MFQKNKLRHNTIISLLVVLFLLINSCCSHKKTTNINNVNTANDIESDNGIINLTIDEMYQPPNTLDYKIIYASINDSILNVEVSYTGGCGNHSWKLMWTGMYFKSLPMKVPLTIQHDANNETCDKIISKKLKYNINAINPGGKNEKVIVLLKGYEGSLEYNVQ